MRYYPLYVNLRGKRCLVVGAGQVGRRKIATLAACGPDEVLVLDRDPPAAVVEELAARPEVVFERRGFAPADLDGRFLVIAATDDEALNWAISRECAARGILCNIVDQPEKCSFIVPALPLEEAGPMAAALAGHGLDLIPLVGLNTSEERLAAYAKGARGFVYFVSVLGTTGMRDTLPAEIVERLKVVRRLFDVPVALGFGIKSPEQLTAFGDLIDAVVFGSALIAHIEDGGTAASFMERWRG